MRWLARRGSHGPAAVAAEHFAQGRVLLIVGELAALKSSSSHGGFAEC